MPFSLILPRRAKAEASDTIDFSYSRPEHSVLRRALIRSIEIVSGQPHLKRLYREFCDDPRPQESFFDAAVRLLELDIRCESKSRHAVPATGPVVFIANHPFGVLDGIVLCWLASRLRSDLRVLVHTLLCQPPELRDVFLPIDFGPTDEARATTLRARANALQWLREGHAIGVFPGGSVATSLKPFTGAARDPAWHPFIAKLIVNARATVVPVYFAGQNSRLFQIASHFNYTARLSLLFRETARRIGTRVDVAVGEPIPFDEIAHFENRHDLLLELRRRTLALASGLGKAVPDFREEFTFPRHIRFD
ncbi:MAG: lysophospholipid acyltransferase family protein [Rhizobiales bacterium]|nr:lysophospholipid acyltransferase family protein [Hyphomicrobiales bacterium]